MAKSYGSFGVDVRIPFTIDKIAHNDEPMTYEQILSAMREIAGPLHSFNVKHNVESTLRQLGWFATPKPQEWRGKKANWWFPPK